MQKLCYCNVINGPTLDQLREALRVHESINLRINHPGTLREMTLKTNVEDFEYEDGSGHNYNLRVRFALQGNLDPVLSSLKDGVHYAFYDAARRTGTVEIASL